MITKDLTLGEFLVSQESALYNTGTIEVTAGSSGAVIFAGQPLTAAGASATSPIGIAAENVTLEANEVYNVAAITNGFGCVLNLSKLTERYSALYPAAQSALEALGFVFK
jgi:hypothetical protein